MPPIPLPARALPRAALVALAFWALGASPLAADGPQIIRASQIFESGHPISLGLERYGELAREKTEGRVRFKIVDATRFGGERDLVEALQMGELDLIAITSSVMDIVISDFLALDLPYLFPNLATARAFLDGPLGLSYLRRPEGQGLIGLTYFDNGFRNISSASKPILLPRDLRGLRVRTIESRVHVAAFREIGAIPVPTPYRDMYQELLEGDIDASENSIPSVIANRLYEVQNYYSLTEHFYLASPLFMSGAAWSKLAPAERAVMRSAAEEAKIFQRGVADSQDRVLSLTQAAPSIGVNANIDRASWARAMAPVRARFRGEIGESEMAALLAAIEEIRAGDEFAP
ncbi:MAG: TRAP transporter substrate-binding protein [Deltaproteobacteria bacterium]|jgi:tripartite ATP-independent transporter DctP family solute receptor|nr:TRAP transporter substrate-binding protein [Deltaproteobacteria bacterium]